MNRKKQIQNDIADHAGMLAKATTFYTVPIGVIAGQLFVLWFSRQSHLFPDNDALMQVIGTCAEIIAGLYGITLAGYTFFLSRMDGLTATDHTLDYIVQSIKRRFKILIWYITATVAVTLFISVLLMYYPASSGIIPEYAYRLLCNEFILFLAFAISLILYYSVGVVDPNCIEKEARRLKKKLSRGRGPDGSAAEFISLYDRIEARCSAMLPEGVLNQLKENKGAHFEYTIELLLEQNALMAPVVYDLHRVHRYYECMVNCHPLSASQEMCYLARNLLSFLEQDGKMLERKN